MTQVVELKVPDLGEFSDVEIIEVLVAPGDVVAVEDGLVTLETDKAAMDVPASHAGTIVTVEVATGDTVSTGDVVATLEATAASGGDASGATQATAGDDAQPAGATARPETTHSAQLVVIGAGPGKQLQLGNGCGSGDGGQQIASSHQ